MSLDNLAKIGRLKEHKATRAEVSDLLAAADRNLADAKVEAISVENRFDAAYKGLHGGVGICDVNRARTTVVDCYTDLKTMNLTAVFEKVSEGYIAFVEELPGANAQGKTLDEARENLREAVELVIEANRQMSEELIRGKSVIREPFKPAA